MLKKKAITSFPVDTYLKFFLFQLNVNLFKSSCVIDVSCLALQILGNVIDLSFPVLDSANHKTAFSLALPVFSTFG